MEGLTPENFDDFINHIYDKIFKLFFKHKPVAVDCLTYFVDKEVVEQLDLEQMTLKDTNFISKDLEEFYSDVIYETYLKTNILDVESASNTSQKRKKQEARVIIVWEHKKSIESYFSLLVQILIYKTQQYELDLKENRDPTLVIPIIVNQDVKPLKSKNFHDCFAHIPPKLLMFVEKFECYVINVHSIKQDVLLQMRGDTLLRGLFLAYQAVESVEQKEDTLIEVFKFVEVKQYLNQFFQPLLAFIIKKGDFSESKIKEMYNAYLTETEQRNIPTKITTADRLEARGEARGEMKRARLMVLRGYCNNVQTELLILLCGLPKPEVLSLEKGYKTVKKAGQKKKVDMSALLKNTTLTEEEIKLVLSSFDGIQ